MPREIEIIKKADIERADARRRRLRRAYLEMLICEDLLAAIHFVRKHASKDKELKYEQS